MKKILLLLTLTLISFTAQAQEIKWMSFNDAIAAQKKNPKPIFLDAYTSWCGPCKMLDKNTFTDSKVIEHINKNYYAVKFNAEGSEVIEYKGVKFSNPRFDPNRKGSNSMHEFTGYLKVPGYPSMIIFNEKGDIHRTIVGYRSAEQLLPEL